MKCGLPESEAEAKLVCLHQALSVYLSGHMPFRYAPDTLDCDCEIAGCKIFFEGSAKARGIRTSFKR